MEKSANALFAMEHPFTMSYELSVHHDNRANRSVRLAQLRGWIACAMLAVSVGCRDAMAPSDSALTGRWFENGTDTYTQLILENRGGTVSGSYGFCGFVGSPLCGPTFDVSGTAFILPHVVLAWSEPNGTGGTLHLLIDATLSADGTKLTGTVSVDGQGANPTDFHR